MKLQYKKIMPLKNYVIYLYTYNDLIQQRKPSLTYFCNAFQHFNKGLHDNKRSSNKGT